MVSDGGSVRFDRRLLLLVLLGAVAAVVALLASSASAQRGPTPEPNFATDLTQPRPCALDTRDPYEKKFYKFEGWSGPNYVRYPGACERT